MKNHNENDKYSIYCMIKFGEVPQLVSMVKKSFNYLSMVWSMVKSEF